MVVNSLTAKQRSAIERAKRSPELQPILFRKATGIHWFDAFREAGFLRPTEIPAPIPAKEEGYVTIPVWPITNYLVATSIALQEPDHERYIHAFLDFMRAATNYAKTENYGNYRVWWQFSKIIRNIPPQFLTADDLALFDYWLDDAYERGLVAESLGEFLLGLLTRNDQHSRQLSVQLLEALFKTTIVMRTLGDSAREEAVLRFDGYHARELTKKIAPAVGRVLRLTAAEIFQERLESLLTKLDNDKWSSLWRPAIQDHEQNHGRDDVESIIVEAHRDSLLAFIDSEPVEAEAYVLRLLERSFETTRRIAIYVLDQRFLPLHGLVTRAIGQAPFTSNIRHELWHLLRNHYPQFPQEAKTLVQNAIATLDKTGDGGRHSEGATAYARAIWLAAIKDYDDNLAKIYQACIAVIGGEPEHPDFSSYMSSGSVDHKSPIPKDELLALDIPDLAARLNNYQDPGRFGEPGLEGLVKALRQIVKAEPLRFHGHLQAFTNLDYAYVHEVIEAYNEL
ncbi:MAG: hypothetical protein MN733_43065, partial [Nitrososphaera sp.]|nr:hypothetical protein [Nitrososphaera sp.]